MQRISSTRRLALGLTDQFVGSRSRCECPIALEVAFVTKTRFLLASLFAVHIPGWTQDSIEVRTFHVTDGIHKLQGYGGNFAV